MKFRTDRPLTIILIPLYGYRYLRVNLYRDLFNQKGIEVMVIQLKEK
jgi:hypothetical protein